MANPIRIRLTVVAILLVALGLTNLMIDAQLPMIMLDVLEQHITSPLEFLLLLNLFLLSQSLFSLSLALVYTK